MILTGISVDYYYRSIKPEKVTPTMTKLVKRILEKDLKEHHVPLPSGIMMVNYELYTQRFYSVLHIVDDNSRIRQLSRDIRKKYLLPEDKSNEITYMVIEKLK